MFELNTPVPHDFLPAANISETKDAVVVEMSLAGVDPEKVDIEVKDNVLTVKGSTEHKTEVEEKNYVRREIRSGSFYRTLPLPANVVGGKASAESENGMLKVTIPKVKEEKVSPIKVQVKKTK